MKAIISKIGAMLVKLGKSLMLPIAVLPIAGLLLRLGQPDMLNIPFMAQAAARFLITLPLSLPWALPSALARKRTARQLFPPLSAMWL